jgi:RNA polymerase sigma-70 factor (ECF subfamily)
VFEDGFAEGSDEPVMLALKNQAVRAAVLALPKQRRLVTVLRYWHHLPDNEIADTLGIEVGTVGATASAARATLRKSLGEFR